MGMSIAEARKILGKREEQAKKQANISNLFAIILESRKISFYYVYVSGRRELTVFVISKDKTTKKIPETFEGYHVVVHEYSEPGGNLF